MEAALSLYQEEEEAHAQQGKLALKIPINKGSGWYSPLLGGVFWFLFFSQKHCLSLASSSFSLLRPFLIFPETFQIVWQNSMMVV